MPETTAVATFDPTFTNDDGRLLLLGTEMPVVLGLMPLLADDL